MDFHAIEATQAVIGGPNWGKFGLGRWTDAEWALRSAMPGATWQRLIGGRGWSRQTIWVMDLQTGEAAMFWPGGNPHSDLQKKQIWVCPMYEPFLEWLYGHVREHEDEWWDALPALVELPHAQQDLFGYRRPGPAGQ